MTRSKDVWSHVHGYKPAEVDFRDFFEATVEGVEFTGLPRPVWYSLGSLGTEGRYAGELHIPAVGTPVIRMCQGTTPLDRAWAATCLRLARLYPTHVLAACDCWRCGGHGLVAYVVTPVDNGECLDVDAVTTARGVR
ncbi:hypothetical protein [Actinomyces provencensis]|uniref:hypothetical protein n=1 Tax=Actinomyces provencensis TaxID=1720198 RepID=UPI00096ABC72|nr:hypothetical protein [Actinomyces provencensis]